MRASFIFPMLLLAAFTTGMAAPSAEPTVRVEIEDLSLDDQASRAELRERISAAARDFCLRHEEDITPQLLRHDRRYCPQQIRASLVVVMPPKVRRAYALALREAGMTGRDLQR